MKKAQSKVIVILLIVIAVALVVVAINSFKPSSTGNVLNEKCGEEYINYQGSCCLDSDYNNICDTKELSNKPQSEGKYQGSCSFSDIQCVGQGGETVINRETREVCRATCEDSIGKCVLVDCRIADCIINSDCRNGKMCANDVRYNYECI